MNNTSIHQEKKEDKTISITLPKLGLPSIQAVILTLLILVGLLQTLQLYGLSQQVVSAKVSSSGSPTSVTASGGSTGSATEALPDMVGGC